MEESWFRTCKVFISPAWTFNDEYNRLVSVLNHVPNFKWENCCKWRSNYLYLDKQEDTELEQELRHQMHPADIVIILLYMYRLYGKWMEKERNLALEMKKPIIGILPWDNSEMPQAEKLPLETVNWDVVSIIDAIEKHVRSSLS